MRESLFIFHLLLIYFFSFHNEIQGQGYLPADSLRQLAITCEGKEKQDLLMRIAMSTNDIVDWDATLNNAINRCDTPAICRSRLNRIQCLFNFYSADSAIIEAQKSLPFMLDAKQYSFYFSAYNTYISGLFKQRRFDEAREEATAMFETAQQVKQPVGMTMALQVQGSIYYKLGLYEQALTSLEKGIAICPTYENGENQVLYISATLYEWLFMTALKINDTERISRYADSYAALVNWRDEHGKVDPTGHYPVTSQSLQALSYLKKGQTKEARQLLNEASRLIHPQIPANAYEHFYEARRDLREITGDYQGAIKDMDILLAAHQNDLSFYMDDLLKKAELLAHSGDPQSCISLYHTYIQAKDSVNQLDIASRMDQLRTIYEVDRLGQEKKNARIWMSIALVVCLLLGILLSGNIIYSLRLRAKSRVLYRRIQEQTQRENMAVETIKQIPEGDLSRELRLFINLNELLEKEKLFTDPALNRDELAQRLGTNRTYLIEAVRAYGGNMTVREFLNDFRLKHAVELLAQTNVFSIDQICYDSGFASRSVFYRLFRQSYGMSPTEYRKLSGEAKISPPDFPKEN